LIQARGGASPEVFLQTSSNVKSTVPPSASTLKGRGQRF
jgi:hypothetical protein